MKKIILIGFLLSCFIALVGCGFQPLYASPEGAENHPLLRQIRVGAIISTRDAGEGNLAVQPVLRRALENRLLVNQAQSEGYELAVEVTPRARRLAVQLDASVTRFNYSLFSKYRLVHLETGASISGNPTSITSFNQVTSQYSSLFAEREAVQKSATRLAEEIERDILSQTSDMERRIAIARRQKAKAKTNAVEELEGDEKKPDFLPDLIP